MYFLPVALQMSAICRIVYTEIEKKVSFCYKKIIAKHNVIISIIILPVILEDGMQMIGYSTIQKEYG